jgi:hypothetical protein
MAEEVREGEWTWEAPLDLSSGERASGVGGRRGDGRIGVREGRE